MNITLYTVSAFTKNNTGGNLAGIVLNADNLSNAQKQKIATIANYSETAFVGSDPQVDFSVSFFTPTAEVNFCGHATLALFYLLFHQGIISEGSYQQRTKAGILSVTLSTDGEVVMQQTLPQTLANFSIHEIAPLLNQKSEILQNQPPIEVLSTGLSDLIISIPVGLLDSITPNLSLIHDFCLLNNIIGFHLFELNEANSEISASCRNFAPLVGIDEESATGSACGALACYLYKHYKMQRFTFQQGKVMGKESRLTASVSVKEDSISRVEVGGLAKLIACDIISL
jgi:PhzF family phenazine biosynthesis protein